MTERSLAEWLKRLEGLHPRDIDLGLERVRTVAAALDLLPSATKTVIVAGTNGKGSVVSSLECALRGLDISCGVYTSPHLVDFNERIRVNGSMVEDADIVAAFAAIDDARGDVSLTYFEFSTLAALLVFRDQAVQWQILEVGLGGRLDAVNIVDAEIAVVTTIGLDHQQWLGPDRDSIAGEKVQVARAECPCVVVDPSPPATLERELARIGARGVFSGRDYHIADERLTTAAGRVCPLPAPPGLLPCNVAAALQVLELMDIDPSAPIVQQALSRLQVPGRRQRIARDGVEWVLDVAHNDDAVAALWAWQDRYPTQGVTRAIYASMADKPYRDILASAGARVQHWFLPRFADVPRAVDPDELQPVVGSMQATVCEDFSSAWRGAESAAKAGDRVLVFGSFVTVGAALVLLQSGTAQVAG